MECNDVIASVTASKPTLATPSKLHSAACLPVKPPSCRAGLTATRRGHSSWRFQRNCNSGQWEESAPFIILSSSKSLPHQLSTTFSEYSISHPLMWFSSILLLEIQLYLTYDKSSQTSWWTGRYFKQVCTMCLGGFADQFSGSVWTCNSLTTLGWMPKSRRISNWDLSSSTQ